jgi:hypothetical protein
VWDAQVRSQVAALHGAIHHQTGSSTVHRTPAFRLPFRPTPAPPSLPPRCCYRGVAALHSADVETGDQTRLRRRHADQHSTWASVPTKIAFLLNCAWGAASTAGSHHPGPGQGAVTRSVAEDWRGIWSNPKPFLAAGINGLRCHGGWGCGAERTRLLSVACNLKSQPYCWRPAICLPARPHSECLITANGLRFPRVGRWMWLSWLPSPVGQPAGRRDQAPRQPSGGRRRQIAVCPR